MIPQLFYKFSLALFEKISLLAIRIQSGEYLAMNMEVSRIYVEMNRLSSIHFHTVNSDKTDRLFSCLKD